MSDLQRRRRFRVHKFRGIDLDDLVKMDREDFIPLLSARQRRRFIKREVPHKYIRLYKKCVEAKKDVPVGEKPKAVKTHLRNAIVLPELVGSVVAVYNGKSFTTVEIKPDMIGHYLGEYSMSYKPVRHGRPGIGATHSSKFVPLK